MGKPGPDCYEVAGRGDLEWITSSTLTFHRYQQSSSSSSMFIQNE